MGGLWAPVQSTARTGVLRAFSGSYRGLTCQCLHSFTWEGCPAVCAGCNYSEIHSASGKNRVEGKETKQEQQLTAFYYRHNFVIPPIHPHQGCCSKNRDKSTLMRMKCSVHHYFYQQDHYHHSALQPRAAKRHFAVALFLFLY